MLEFQPLQLCLAIHSFSDVKYCSHSFSKGHMLKEVGTSQQTGNVSSASLHFRVGDKQGS